MNGGVAQKTRERQTRGQGTQLAQSVVMVEKLKPWVSTLNFDQGMIKGDDQDLIRTGSTRETNNSMAWRWVSAEDWTLNFVALRKPRGPIASHETDNPDKCFGRSIDLRRGDIVIHTPQTT